MKKFNIVIKLSVAALASALLAGCNGSGSTSHKSGIGYSSSTIDLTNGVQHSGVSTAYGSATSDADIVPSQSFAISYNDDPVTVSIKDANSQLNLSKTGQCQPISGFLHCSEYVINYTPSDTTSNISDSISVVSGTDSGSIPVQAYVPTRFFAPSATQYSSNPEDVAIKLSSTQSGLEYNSDINQSSSGFFANSDKEGDWLRLTNVVSQQEMHISMVGAHFGKFAGHDALNFQYSPKIKRPGKAAGEVVVPFILSHDFFVTTNKGNIYSLDTMGEPSNTLPTMQVIKLSPSGGSNDVPVSDIVSNHSIDNFALTRTPQHIGIYASNYYPPYNDPAGMNAVASSSDGGDYDLDARMKIAAYVDSSASDPSASSFKIQDMKVYAQTVLDFPKAIILETDNEGSEKGALHLTYNQIGDVHSWQHWKVHGLPSNFLDSQTVTMAVSIHKDADGDTDKLYVLISNGSQVYSGSVSTFAPSSYGIDMALCGSNFKAATSFTVHSHQETSTPDSENLDTRQYLVVENLYGSIDLIDPENPATPYHLAAKNIDPLGFACNDVDTGADGKTYTMPTCYLVGTQSDGPMKGALYEDIITGFNPLAPSSDSTVSQYFVSNGLNHGKAVVDGDTGSIMTLDTVDKYIKLYTNVSDVANVNIRRVSLPNNIAGEAATGVYDY